MEAPSVTPSLFQPPNVQVDVGPADDIPDDILDRTYVLTDLGTSLLFYFAAASPKLSTSFKTFTPVTRSVAFLVLG